MDIEKGKQLVKICRKVIENYLKGEKIQVKREKWMEEERGVFVTLKKWPTMKLRGCIGHPYPDSALIDALIDSAISAAVSDPRFRPVTYDEMKEIVIEISILTKPEEITGEPKDRAKKIRCGRDGLIVKQGYNAGLLLPQVAEEYGWTEQEFLSQTCWKAGLTPDCWLEGRTKVYRFEAEIFNEKEPNGEVEKE